jgi:restriction system protein
LDYVADSKLLIVEYHLPAISAMPTLKELKYIASKDQFQEVRVSDPWLNRTYDDVLYQITLRTVYELFQSDVVDALATIVFNGWVNSVDRSTGQEVNACILSLQAAKAEFTQINLANVEPKACFKKLQGVSASRLTSLSPVKPILRLNREDRRFIASYEVADELDSAFNLAAVDWQDFENLIREIFEKEFSRNGGEVKITQASRDGVLMLLPSILTQFVAGKLSFRPNDTQILSGSQLCEICSAQFTTKAQSKGFWLRRLITGRTRTISLITSR